MAMVMVMTRGVWIPLVCQTRLIRTNKKKKTQIRHSTTAKHCQIEKRMNERERERESERANEANQDIATERTNAQRK